jgi:hypothetical protein
MCNPIVAATVGISVAGAAAQYFGQEQAAKDMTKYQTEAQSQAIETARKDFALKTQQSQIGLSQAQNQGTQRQTNDRLDAAKALATAKVSAAEAGASGNSVDQLYRDYLGQDARLQEATQTTVTNQRQQYRVNALGDQAAGNNFVAGFRSAPNRGGDPVAALLQIGAGGLMAYDRNENANFRKQSALKTA